MYRVDIIDQEAGSGGIRTDDNLARAICDANEAAMCITPTAMIVGVLAWAIAEERLSPGAAVAARELIASIGVPLNMIELVECADDTMKAAE